MPNAAAAAGLSSRIRPSPSRVMSPAGFDSTIAALRLSASRSCCSHSLRSLSARPASASGAAGSISASRDSTKRRMRARASPRSTTNSTPLRCRPSASPASRTTWPTAATGRLSPGSRKDRSSLAPTESFPVVSRSVPRTLMLIVVPSTGSASPLRADQTTILTGTRSARRRGTLRRASILASQCSGSTGSGRTTLAPARRKLSSSSRSRRLSTAIADERVASFPRSRRMKPIAAAASAPSTRTRAGRNRRAVS
jgi:hypothetical protein